MIQKGSLIVMLFFLALIQVFAQKKTITLESAKIWNRLGEYGISDDGKYAWYTVNSEIEWTVSLCSTSGEYRRNFSGAIQPAFINSDKLIFKTLRDSLGIFDLKTSSLQFLSGVTDYKINVSGENQYLLYRTDKKVHLINFSNKKHLTFNTSGEYKFSPDGRNLIIADSAKLICLNLISERTSVVPNSGQCSRITFNKKGDGFAFFVTDEQNNISAHMYKIGDQKAENLVDNTQLNLGSKITDQVLIFTPDGKRVFFKVEHKLSKREKDQDKITEELTIWNHQASILPGESMFYVLEDIRKFSIMCVSLNDKKAVQLDDDKISIEASSLGVSNKYVIAKSLPALNSGYRDPIFYTSYHIINIATGKTNILTPDGYNFNWPPVMSPSGYFVTWNGGEKKELYCYDLETGKTFNNSEWNKMPITNNFWGAIKWLDNDKGYFVYDSHNQLWFISPSNKFAGEKMVGESKELQKLSITFCQGANVGSATEQSRLMVSVLDSNYNNGLGFLSLKHKPKLIYDKLSSSLYWLPLKDAPLEPLKAKDANVYITSRQSATEAPNLYVSNDLINFRQLSDIQPQIDYNWLTSDLIRWKKYDGTLGKGILYRPENFDASKKYPVIFWYYQAGECEHLHEFKSINVDEGANNLNIAEYVSNGYIVFVPEISNEVVGNIAKSTINSVESAAKYLLRTYPYIDEKRLGLQGHSFGGYETNIIIGNSKMFAAASSSAGISNLVSEVGQSGHGRKTLEWMVETGQFNLGLNVLPSTETATYIANSPLFQAGQVVTPLLLKHAKDDSAVPCEQSKEFFAALRRLNKPVWYLEYKSGGHIMSGLSGKDFQIRQKQFFDHYLMGKPAPVWMTTSIPENEQLWKSGLQPEISSIKP